MAKIQFRNLLILWPAFVTLRDGIEYFREDFGCHVAINDGNFFKLCHSFDGGLHFLDLWTIELSDVHTTQF